MDLSKWGLLTLWRVQWQGQVKAPKKVSEQEVHTDWEVHRENEVRSAKESE